MAQAKLYPALWGKGPQQAVFPPLDPAFEKNGVPITFSVPSGVNNADLSVTVPFLLLPLLLI